MIFYLFLSAEMCLGFLLFCLGVCVCVSYLVSLLLRDVQVSLAAHHGLVIASEDLQRVPQVPARLRFPDPVSNRPADTQRCHFHLFLQTGPVIGHPEMSFHKPDGVH